MPASRPVPAHSRWNGIQASLLRSRDMQAVPCLGVDMMQRGIGIVSTEQLQVGDRLVLKVAEREMALHVDWKRASGGRTPASQYGLTPDSGETIEQVLFNREGDSDDAGQLPDYSIVLLNGCRARAARFAADGRIEARVRTFGTMVEYRFTAENVSASGMLLVPTGLEQVAPFREHSLLEILITPRDARNAIEAIAKVMRLVRHPDEQRLVAFGVQVSEFASGMERRWLELIDAAEKAAASAEASQVAMPLAG